MGECGHCWHRTGEYLCSWPPRYFEYCCKCDGKRTTRDIIFITNNTNHGPFFKENP